MGKCLHNTLNVRYFDTYVLSLKKIIMSVFDSLEGVVETVTRAVLHLLFTLVTDNKISSHARCILLWHKNHNKAMNIYKSQNRWPSINVQWTLLVLQKGSICRDC